MKKASQSSQMSWNPFTKKSTDGADSGHFELLEVMLLSDQCTHQWAQDVIENTEGFKDWYLRRQAQRRGEQ